MLVGFVGQGYVGKHYADEFEARGFSIVRYAKEPDYVGNRDRIRSCDIVFIAVPTPTTNGRFDISIVDEALSLVGKGKVAVIKSTILPGTTVRLQKKHKDIFVMHSPEFLRETSAARDVAHPERTIVGIPLNTKSFREKAAAVLRVLPRAPYEKVMPSTAAELVKYAGNCFLYTKLVYANLLFDLSKVLGIDWDDIREAVSRDSRIGPGHMKVLDASGGRGAGGHCFIKDFAALEGFYTEVLHDTLGERVLKAISAKNRDLLRQSGKDLDLLRGVYGDIV
ncbi:MAG: UDP-glucose/GDP-mannose dehydrogenase family protein [Methylomonas sp.]|nr:UDP-glucose/GDP-mannose dehydrogenase family protein [Methylomonas sp.]